MANSSSSLSQKLGKRLKKAADVSSQFRLTYDQMMPVLQRGVSGFGEMETELKKMSDLATGLHQEFEIIHGYLQEGQEIAGEHWDDMAQIATLMLNYDVFIKGDFKAILHALEIVDPPVLQEALNRIDPERLTLIQGCLNEAYKKSKKI